jgi:hypothetical protein
MKTVARPQARTQGVVVRTVENETLVYDLSSNDTLCLDQTLSTVWSQCDGTRSVDDISRLVAPHEAATTRRDLTWIALEQLRAKGLLVDGTFGDASVNRFHGLSRREMIRQAGVIGVLVPTLLTMAASPAASAASLVCDCSAATGSDARPQGCPCVTNNDCCGVCQAGVLTCSATTPIGTHAACCPLPA